MKKQLKTLAVIAALAVSLTAWGEEAPADSIGASQQTAVDTAIQAAIRAQLAAQQAADAAVEAQAAAAAAAAYADSITLATDPLTKTEIPVFSREIKQITFVPKGQWIAGVSVNYSQSDQDNYQFLIIESLNGDTYSFKVSPMLFYTFADNLAAGGKFAYTRQRTRLNSANIKLDSETGYDIDNLYSISHTYSAMAAFRNYISLGGGTRFGLFNEVQLQFSGGESKLCNGSGADLTGTFERTFGLEIGVAPGLIMFLNNYSAIEVNVGVLGFKYSHTKSTTDQVYIANRNLQSANFRVNLFSITFGVVFYI